MLSKERPRFVHYHRYGTANLVRMHFIGGERAMAFHGRDAVGATAPPPGWRSCRDVGKMGDFLRLTVLEEHESSAVRLVTWLPLLSVTTGVHLNRFTVTAATACRQILRRGRL